ncbi:hypothetical protein ABT063_02110 [Streptomyces sp. NPDC002838]|uniref:hypothetical protein n=1 Tax=Streptomyces sp. NPDC002838 TaxID=3154436 RepID=UPI0033321D8B
MRTRTALPAVLLAAATATTGCSSDSEPAASNKTTPAATKTTSAPTPSQSTPAAPRAIGQTLTFTGDDGVTFDVTVMGYEQDVAKNSVSADEEFDTNGYVWAAVDIRACLKKGKAGVTRYPWALAYADGARIEPSSVTYDDFPRPEYPYEAEMKAGECVRGKTVFPVPGDQRPERILYTADSLPETAEWAVPKE